MGSEYKSGISSDNTDLPRNELILPIAMDFATRALSGGYAQHLQEQYRTKFTNGRLPFEDLATFQVDIVGLSFPQSCVGRKLD